MIHPLRSAPALVVTVVVGLLVLPGSVPARFDGPTTAEDDHERLLAVGTAGALDPSRTPAFPTAFHSASDEAGRRYLLEVDGSSVLLTRWSHPDSTRSSPDFA